MSVLGRCVSSYMVCCTQWDISRWEELSEYKVELSSQTVTTVGLEGTQKELIFLVRRQDQPYVRTWLQTKVYLSCSSGSVVLEQLCEQRISDFLDFAILQCVVGMSKFYLIINVISFSQFFLHWHLNPVIKRALYTYFCITF